MSKEDKLWEKLTCKCGEFFTSKYTDEYLTRKYPYEGVGIRTKIRNINKWRKLKRELKCPKCGTEKKISLKLLLKISKINYEQQVKGDK